jgi:hypothetical protein
VPHHGGLKPSTNRRHPHLEVVDRQQTSSLGHTGQGGLDQLGRLVGQALEQQRIPILMLAG